MIQGDKSFTSALRIRGPGLFAIAVIFSSCLTPVRTAVQSPPVAAVSTNIRIALVHFLPLPPDYPRGARLYELDGSGELFEMPDRKTRVFVPRDYQDMIPRVLALALREAGFHVASYSSLTAASSDRPNVIVYGGIKTFLVSPAEPGFKASAVFHLVLADGNLNIFWRGDLPSHVMHSGLEIANIVDPGDGLAINELSFHPLRALLAQAIYDTAASLVGLILDRNQSKP